MKIKFTDIPETGYRYAADGVGMKTAAAKPGEVHDVMPNMAGMLIEAGRAIAYVGNAPAVSDESTDKSNEADSGWGSDPKTKALELVIAECKDLEPDDAKLRLAEWAETKNYEVDLEAEVDAIVESLTVAVDKEVKSDTLEAVITKCKDLRTAGEKKELLAKWADSNDLVVETAHGVDRVIAALRDSIAGEVPD